MFCLLSLPSWILITCMFHYLILSHKKWRSAFIFYYFIFFLCSAIWMASTVMSSRSVIFLSAIFSLLLSVLNDFLKFQVLYFSHLNHPLSPLLELSFLSPKIRFFSKLLNILIIWIWILGPLFMTFLALFLLTNDYSNFELHFPASSHACQFLIGALIRCWTLLVLIWWGLLSSFKKVLNFVLAESLIAWSFQGLFFFFNTCCYNSSVAFVPGVHLSYYYGICGSLFNT